MLKCIPCAERSIERVHAVANQALLRAKNISPANLSFNVLRAEECQQLMATNELFASQFIESFRRIRSADAVITVLGLTLHPALAACSRDSRGRLSHKMVTSLVYRCDLESQYQALPDARETLHEHRVQRAHDKAYKMGELLPVVEQPALLLSWREAIRALQTHHQKAVAGGKSSTTLYSTQMSDTMHLEELGSRLAGKGRNAEDLDADYDIEVADDNQVIPVGHYIIFQVVDSCPSHLMRAQSAEGGDIAPFDMSISILAAQATPFREGDKVSTIAAAAAAPVLDDAGAFANKTFLWRPSHSFTHAEFRNSVVAWNASTIRHSWKKTDFERAACHNFAERLVVAGLISENAEPLTLPRSILSFDERKALMELHRARLVRLSRESETIFVNSTAATASNLVAHHILQEPSYPLHRNVSLPPHQLCSYGLADYLWEAGASQQIRAGRSRREVATAIDANNNATYVWWSRPKDKSLHRNYLLALALALDNLRQHRPTFPIQHSQVLLRVWGHPSRAVSKKYKSHCFGYMGLLHMLIIAFPSHSLSAYTKAIVLGTWGYCTCLS